MTKTVEDLRIGDIVMPPARELRLWMRRELVARGLPESALYLTVMDIYEGASDKNGVWLLIKTAQTTEWLGDHKPLPFTFKARPTSPWVKIGTAPTEGSIK